MSSSMPSHLTIVPFFLPPHRFIRQSRFNAASTSIDESLASSPGGSSNNSRGGSGSADKGAKQAAAASRPSRQKSQPQGKQEVCCVVSIQEGVHSLDGLLTCADNHMLVHLHTLAREMRKQCTLARNAAESEFQQRQHVWGGREPVAEPDWPPVRP